MHARILASVLVAALCVAAAIASSHAAPAASIPLYRHDSIRTIALRANMTLPVFERPRGGSGDIIPLHDYQNAQYFAPLEVGTPPKAFLMVYDTGSSDVWVPQHDCLGCTAQHTTYDASQSSTSQPDGSPFTITYGSGNVSGTNVFDTVSFGDVTVSHYNFAQVMDARGLGSLYANSPMDGIVGLAFPQIASSPHTPLVLEAIQRNLLEEPVFSFYLSRTNGQDGTMDFGGIDRSKYTGELQYVPVTKEAWWTVQLDSVSVKGQTVSTANMAIVDSGTSLLVGPTADIQNLAQALGAQTTPYGLYSLPCDRMSTADPVMITLSGHVFEIPVSALLLQQVDPQTCLIGLESMDDAPMWILGDVFMRQYFTVFDYGQKRVGFAKAV